MTSSRGKTGSARRLARIGSLVGAISALFAPLHAASAGDLESAFDRALGAAARPAPVAERPAPRYQSMLEAQVASLASAEQGRIGVAALDLGSGRSLHVLGDQPFPLASTSKIAIAATYLDGVDRGIYAMDAQYPLLVPVPSRKLAGPVAPVRPGQMLSAQSLIELALTRSDNQATDALLAAVGGPGAVNRWLSKAGVNDFRIDRDIATLVRDDGIVDPAHAVEKRDAATPLAMVRLLTGLYRGDWLSAESRTFLLRTMERCVTGKKRIPALLPAGTIVAHKTGSLNNTSSDVGIIQMPDGRAVAVAIYVTGQGTRANREARIASISRAIYDGYYAQPGNARVATAR